MPLVTIESFENETRTSATGNDYDCVVFYGTKHGYEGAEDEPWEKPMVPWADSEWINEIQSYKLPAKLLIKNEKEGKHWRIVSIEAWGDTKKNPGSSPSGTPAGNPVVPNVPIIPQGLVAANTTMDNCMSDAVSLVRGMMDNAETFKSMIKKSAGTELVIQLTKDIANELYRAVKDKDKEVEADAPGLEPESEKLPEDEIPF